MRIFAYREGDRRRLGVLDGPTPRSLSDALEAAGVVAGEHDLLRQDFFRPQRLVAFLKRYGRFAPRIEGEIRFEAPVLPGKILAIGRNFAEHARELGNAVEEEILFFAKLPESIAPHGAPIRIPRGAGRVDHEAELAVVIARDGSRIPEAKAFSHVAGYTCLNDITAREQQMADKAKGKPWLRSKSRDTFCPLGPYLVPLDDVADPHRLRIVCRVNGEVRQDGNTSALIHPIGKLISALSFHATLRAGDVIAIGTPKGVGPIRPGDTVEVEIEKVGLLRNQVVGEEEDPPFDRERAYAALRPRIAEAILASRDGGEAFERVVDLLDELPHFHWTGVYRLEPGGYLGLGPFRGKATEHTRIAPGRGVCGRALAEDRTVVVDDVAKDPNYLACSAETRSEIVVPVRADGRPVAEIDVDSDRAAAFDGRDRAFLEEVAASLGSFLERSQLPRMWDER